MPTVLVYHPACPSCQRFLDALRRSAASDPEAAAVQLADVTDPSAAAAVRGFAVTSVPTLVTPDGRRLSGTKAFEWLDQRRAPPAPFAGGFGATGFSGFSGAAPEAAGDGFQQPFAPIQ